jgi:hypothetical protein
MSSFLTPAHAACWTTLFECRDLGMAVTAGAAGIGRVVLLSGEPGIGKSLITAALEERLEAEPHMRLPRRDRAENPVIEGTTQAWDRLRLILQGCAAKTQAQPRLPAAIQTGRDESWPVQPRTLPEFETSMLKDTCYGSAKVIHCRLHRGRRMHSAPSTSKRDQDND